MAADAEDPDGGVDGGEVQCGDVDEGGGGGGCVELLELWWGWGVSISIRIRVGVGVCIGVCVRIAAIAGKSEQLEGTSAVAGRNIKRAAMDKGKVPCTVWEVTTATILSAVTWRVPRTHVCKSDISKNTKQGDGGSTHNMNVCQDRERYVPRPGFQSSNSIS